MSLIKSLNSQRANNDCTYITPKWLTDLLGPFDVDIAAAAGSYNVIGRRENYCGPTGSENCGLAAKLKESDFVWCNPPFAIRHGMDKFIQKMQQHGGGIMLLPANTQQRWFLEFVVPHAASVYFWPGTFKFDDIFSRPKLALGTGIILVEFGQAQRLKRLLTSNLGGQLCTMGVVK